MSCPYCGNKYSEDGSDCMSVECITRRAANYPAPQKPVLDKVAIVRNYGRDVSAEAEALAIAETIEICDCCGYEYIPGQECCNIPGAGIETLAHYWRVRNL